MHRIVKSHLDSYVQSQGLAGDDEATQFEKFANFSVLSNCCSSGFDIDEVTTGAREDGCDGVAAIIDEEVISTVEDAQAIFTTPRRNHDVSFIFVQAKRSEGFDLGDFLKFKESILRFCAQSTYICADETMIAAHEVFEVILKEVPKIRNGQPSIVVRYVSTGVYQSPQALETARQDFERQLNELGLFSDISVQFVDRTELMRLGVNTYSGVRASLDLFSFAALPNISGIDEAYLAVAPAIDFVKSLLMSEDGTLRTQVFEENVRSFLGLDNPVNQSIAETLRSGGTASRFAVLNNGITIVSPEVIIQGNTLHLHNFQIVNGCQTSNILFECRDVLAQIMVNIKVVETKNEDVFADLVKATNSQTKVDDVQFLSLRPIIRKVEQYFATFEGEARLYFERRDRQYVGMTIPALRIFSMHNAAKCVAAMFCHRPELASRYPKVMYQELTDTIFAENNREIVFYAACLTLYRFYLLRSNKTIPQDTMRFKWHLLPIVRAIICGKESVSMSSKGIDKCCAEIIAVMSQPSEKTTEIFQKAVDICLSLGDVTRDRLKRQAILGEMLAKV